MEVVGQEVDVGDDSLEESDSDMASAAASDRSSTSAIIARNSEKNLSRKVALLHYYCHAGFFYSQKAEKMDFIHQHLLLYQHAFVFRHNKKGLEVIYINAVLRFNLIRSLYPFVFLGQKCGEKTYKDNLQDSNDDKV